MNIRLYNARILTMEPGREVFYGEIWVKNDKIAYVAEQKELAEEWDRSQFPRIAWDIELDCRGNLLMPGFYISREDGDVITYDLRTRKPNAGDYMDNATMHSLEHMFATYIRNSRMGNEVVYFGPMGCQTGFYLLVRNSRSPKEVFAMTKEVLRQIYDHKGEVFGKSAIECGHYENLSLAAAKAEAATYLAVLEEQTNMDFTYPE